MAPTVGFEINGAVGVVTLAKPPHNLIDSVLLDGILDSYRRAAESGCRAILLKSAMRHFCAGADVSGFAPGAPRRDQAGLERLLSDLEDVGLPTIAAVHGAALGGGFELALTCDLFIAADTSSIGFAEVTLGLLPLLGGVQRVAERAGKARAKEMAMLGRRHDPRTLERWGIVNLVVAEAELHNAALSWARQLAAGPTIALCGIKALANTAGKSGVAAADARQTEVNSQMWASEDQKRGLTAFRATGPGTAVFQGN